MGADLTTDYLGLQLVNPIVVSACPLTAEIDVLSQLADLGAAAAVMPSLFEEQLQAAAVVSSVRHSPVPGWTESLNYYRELSSYNRAQRPILELCERRRGRLGYRSLPASMSRV